ncbi:hypothetical protein TNCV_2544331 [Trichonephila clavipes]|nr:hypothetical protein TNCV_2544331 [Trichonephila clavipes]
MVDITKDLETVDSEPEDVTPLDENYFGKAFNFPKCHFQFYGFDVHSIVTQSRFNANEMIGTHSERITMRNQVLKRIRYALRRTRDTSRTVFLSAACNNDDAAVRLSWRWTTLSKLITSR